MEVVRPSFSYMGEIWTPLGGSRYDLMPSKEKTTKGGERKKTAKMTQQARDGNE